MPDGYSATAGGGGSFLVGAVDSKLYYRDTGGIGLPTNSPSGVTKVAYNGAGGGCLVIVSGDLHAYYIINGEAVSYLIDNTREWTEISFCTGINDSRCFAIGVADGKLMAVRVVLGDLYVHTLSSSTGWIIAGGIKGEDFLNFTGHRLTSLVIDPAGYLHQVSASAYYTSTGENTFSVSGTPGLSGALDLGDNWQSVSGYMKEIAERGPYGDPFPYVKSASRMYGIQNNKLYSLRHGTTLELGAPSKTQITEFTDWWRVTFVAPDEAVAIRKIAL